MSGGMSADTVPAKEAHDGLCNAECMLQLITAHLRETNGMVDGWKVGEALEGVLRLLDGCHVSLSGAVSVAAAESSDSTVLHG